MLTRIPPSQLSLLQFIAEETPNNIVDKKPHISWLYFYRSPSLRLPWSVVRQTFPFPVGFNVKSIQCLPFIFPSWEGHFTILSQWVISNFDFTWFSKLWKLAILTSCERLYRLSSPCLSDLTIELLADTPPPAWFPPKSTVLYDPSTYRTARRPKLFVWYSIPRSVGH